jgi:hypothetical protein
VDVSEELIASIFRVEEYAKHVISLKVGIFAIGGLSPDYTALYPRRQNFTIFLFIRVSLRRKGFIQ